MVNIILESIRAAIVCMIFVNILYVGSKKSAHLQKGWFYIKLGFGLFLFAMILDISDNFLWLNKYGILFKFYGSLTNQDEYQRSID